MKNQKFFFSVVAMLFVLGVLVLFFFGFNSRVFAQAGTVGLVQEYEQVAVVDRIVGADVVTAPVDDIMPDVAESVTVKVADLGASDVLVRSVPAQTTVVDWVDYVAVKTAPVALDVLAVEEIEVQDTVQVVGDSVELVTGAVDIHLQNNIV